MCYNSIKIFLLKKKKTIRHSSASLFLRCITVTPALGSPERFLHTPALGSERYSSLSQSLLFQSSVGWKGKPFISSHYQRFFLVKTLGYLTWEKGKRSSTIPFTLWDPCDTGILDLYNAKKWQTHCLRNWRRSASVLLSVVATSCMQLLQFKLVKVK